MKKRVVSLFLAIVIFAMAVVVLPQTTLVANAAENSVNTTWDGSVHALEDGQFPSKEMYTLTQDQDEYSMPNIWHATAFNECELDVDVDHGNQHFFKETGVGGDLITAGRGITPNEFKSINGYVGGESAYYAALYNNYEHAQDPKNIRLAVYNYDNFDTTDYQYFRFQMLRQNVELDPNHWGQGDDPYAFVMFYGPNGEKVEKRFTDIFNDNANRVYNYLIDVSDMNMVVTCVEFHFKTIRRESKGLADPARVWVDNIRFVKNATHTQYYASKVNTKKTTFHDCDTATNYQYRIPLSSGGISDLYNYKFQITNESSSCIDGEGAFALHPVDYNSNCWYQVAFQNSTGVRLSDYQYFRFYMHVGTGLTQANLGEAWPNNNDFRVYFNENLDYAATNNDVLKMGYVVNPQITTLKNGVPGAGWYLCTIPINKISPYSTAVSSMVLSKVIKSISIQFGSLKIPTPSGNNKASDYTFHIDQLEFIGYSYEEDTKYKYQSGHYQVIENFENKADAKLNVRSGADVSDYLAVRKEDILYNPTYKNSFGGWLYKYNADTTNNQIGHYYSAEYDYIVSQGRYADWIRANEGSYKNNHSGMLEAAYNLDGVDGGYFNLGKFTNFSLDFSIRPQHQTLNALTAPGLQGTKETFLIRIRSNKNYDNVSTLKFTLNLSSDTTGEGELPFYSSNDGIQILPMEGFRPGRDGVYTCSGSMRITFTLADILANATGNFDIDQVDQIRFVMERSNVNDKGVGTERNAAEYDSRFIDMFLDNFVGFTPDMTVTVKTEGLTGPDEMQPFVFTMVGSDDVTEHVNTTFSLQGNESEVIYNLPFNSYTIYLTNWSWRFKTENKTVAQQMATLDRPESGKFTYKDMVENKIALTYTVVFTPQRTKYQWLNDSRRVRFKAKN